jgi:succinate dehydrogenase / fumarate reductase cytochrome b subunit
MYKNSGFISFAFRRISGIALVLYLFTHIMVIGSVNFGPEAFNGVMEFMQSPGFRLAEIALLAAVIYHGVDGIRLLIVNVFKVTETRKSLFWAVIVVSIILGLAGGIPMFIFMLQEIGIL